MCISHLILQKITKYICRSFIVSHYDSSNRIRKFIRVLDKKSKNVKVHHVLLKVGSWKEIGKYSVTFLIFDDYVFYCFNEFNFYCIFWRYTDWFSWTELLVISSLKINSNFFIFLFKMAAVYILTWY